MIFKPELVEKILAGEKTVTRRRVKHKKVPLELPPGAIADLKLEAPCRYKPGRTYALQPGRGEKAVGRIRILDVQREHSFGSVRLRWGDLRREGFKSYAEFERYLRHLYGQIPPGPVHRIEFELVPTEGAAQ